MSGRLDGMWLRPVAGPLTRATTYRRAAFLSLGGLLLVAYVVVGAVVARLWADAAVPWPLASLLTVAAAVTLAPAFLGGFRALEIAGVRALLDADVPDPIPHRRLDPETRLRTAVWAGVHLVTGGLVVLGLITVPPAALVLVAMQFGLRASALPWQPFGPLEAHHGITATLIALAALGAFGYGVAGLGAVARSVAPRLLGPSPRERIVALEAQAGRLAERDRLARELHDSIGHALSVTTLQAAAAREVLDSDVEVADVEFAREALRTIEEGGRRAMEELDYVLGLLRERDPALPRGRGGDATGPAQRRTLADLDRLLAETRATGVPVAVEASGPLDRLPAVVSREGYRIVQEGLTNAVRHAGGGTVTLRVEASRTALDIDLANALGAATGRGGGRGLAGMRERVAAIGGSMTAGPDGAAWRVRVRLPAPSSGDA